MRIALFLSTLLLATPAKAQSQPYQQPAPDLAGGYQRALRSVAPAPQPTVTVQPAPLGGYSVHQTPSYGTRSLSCRPRPLGGYDCQ
jgi:hypothetical protein